MTSNTISGTYSAGYTVSVTTLFNTGTIDGALTSTGVGLYSTNAETFTLANSGLIQPGTNHVAVSILGNGVIANESGGVIAGSSGIVLSGGTGAVSNAGIIAGASHDGISLTGGSVSNAASGTITGRLSDGIYISGASRGTVVNAGSIAGYTGILLQSSGLVSNAASASITGTLVGISILGSSVGTVVNAGTITAVIANGLQMLSGGVVSNATSGTIIGGGDGIIMDFGAGGTVANAGDIQSVGFAGIGLQSGGLISNAANASITGGANGIYGSGDATTVVNAGNLFGTKYSGIYLMSGGSISNMASGSIAGGTYGITIAGSAGTVVNAGMIAGTNSVGILLNAGGSISNTASAFISGGTNGIAISGQPGTVVNAGTIVGTAHAGIYAKSIDTVTNFASGIIRGSIGLDFLADGTLTNAGIVIGKGGAAVTFGGSDYNRLVVDPGAVFSGLVTANTVASNTLELSSAAATGILNGLGTEFTNFGTIVFDAGARWDVSGNTIGFGGTISGFSVGDTIEITGITATGSSYFGGILTLGESSGVLPLNIPGDFTTEDFVVSNVAAGVNISVTCFRAGTRIRTADGDVPVEGLRVGEMVLALAGKGRMAPRPIVWIGFRSVDCRRHPKAGLVWPVRLRAGALGRGQPMRDLFLSPDHAVFIDDVLIPVKYLINHQTIAQMPVASVEYFHLELANHALVLAEGLLVESHLATAARGNCINAGGAIALHPDFSSRAWEAAGYAPLVITGPKLEAARRRINRLAARQGLTINHPCQSISID